MSVERKVRPVKSPESVGIPRQGIIFSRTGLNLTEVIIHDYVVGKKSAAEIHNVLGSAESTIYSILKENEIPRRSREKALGLVWQDPTRREVLLEKIQSPSAQEKRIRSLIKHYNDPKNREAISKRSKEVDARKRRERIDSMKSFLGLESDEKLRVKLKELYKASNSLSRASHWLTQEGFTIGASAFRSVMVELGVAIHKRNTGERGAWVNEDNERLVLEARKSGIFDKLEPRQRKLLDLRHPEGGEPLTHEKIGKIIGAKRTTIVEREKAAFRTLKKLSFPNSPVDSKAA